MANWSRDGAIERDVPRSSCSFICFTRTSRASSANWVKPHGGGSGGSSELWRARSWSLFAGEYRAYLWSWNILYWFLYVDRKCKRKEAANCEESFRARTSARATAPLPLLEEGQDGGSNASAIESQPNKWANERLFLTCFTILPSLLMAAFVADSRRWNFLVESWEERNFRVLENT